ncbi:MAG: sulfurtransferase, partial [Stenotrophomonas sp.]
MTTSPSPGWTTLVDVVTLAAALEPGAPRLLDARATASAAPRVLDARFSLADPQAGAQAYA